MNRKAPEETETNCPPHEEEINILSKNYEAGFMAGMEFEAKHRLLSEDAETGETK
jgi:hypothetical protein